MLDEFSTLQFNKMISNANDNHDNYSKIHDLYPYNALFDFHSVPNGWKLKPIESIPTNVSFDQLSLDIVQPMQKKKKKQKKNQMKPELPAKVKILIYCCIAVFRTILEEQNTLGTKLLYICTFICVHI